MSVCRAALLVVAAVAAPILTARAQDWRTLDVSRQLHDSSALQVHVQYGAGKLGLQAASTPVLYQMQLRYDAEHSEPVHTYAAAARTLSLGIRNQSVNFPGNKNGGDLRVDLAPQVPLELDLDLGVVEANLNLTGLRLQRLNVQSGASDASIRFDTLNSERMRRIDLQVGAASLRAVGLANANATEIHVQAGVGGVDLDLGGEWTHDIDLEVEVALGGVTVHVPPAVGVRVEIEKVLASFEHAGLIKRDGAYYSDNWNSAPHKLRIKAQTTLGQFELDRR